MLLFTFVSLQLMDALTTLFFLSHGIREANPLIAALLQISNHAEWALATPKLFAVALAIYAWRSGRSRLLRKMNVVFAACVAWNVAAILCYGR